MNGEDFAIIDNGNSFLKCQAPDILPLQSQDSQKDSPCTTSTMAPLGDPTRMIFLHCQFSVGKPVRGGKELLPTKLGLADLL